jgi:signal transduction histidine kinase
MDQSYSFTVRTRSLSWLPGVRLAVGGSYKASAPAATASQPLLWWLYGFDTVLLLALGILFANNGSWLMGWFGIPREAPVLWPAAGLTRLFGGALIAMGIAAMGVWRSREPEFQESMAGYFRNAHLVLAAWCLLQQLGTFDGPGGFVLFDVLLLPWGLFWYHRLAGPRHPAAAAVRNTAELRDEWECRIREAAGQQERSRLAQELHDSIKQQIYAIQTHLAAAQARAGEAATAVLEPMEHARSSARQAMAEMNTLLDQLRASPLESVGLVEALRRQCEALECRTGAQVAAHIGTLPPNETLPPGAPSDIFRIAQEGLSNVARHARATHVELALKTAGGELTLHIRDDGQGFDPVNATGGMGLKNMMARAASIGGKLRIESVPGAGCTVTLQVPVAASGSRELQRHLRLAGDAAVLAALLGWLGFAVVETNGRSYLLPLAAAAALGAVYHASAAARKWMQARRRG